MTDLTPEQKAIAQERFQAFINSPAQVEKRRIEERTKVRAVFSMVDNLRHDLNVLQDRLTELEPILVRFITASENAE